MIRRIACFRASGTDPYRNLAIEHYLFDTVEEGCCILYLWQNRRTVVIGRNQNAWRECRVSALREDGGTLARRLSGGGAVYHDKGNLNFTFCVRTEDYDLARQQRVIMEACRLLGIEAKLSGRNDILASGRKFSGNSFYSQGLRSFHNGTMLVSANMAELSRYLSPSSAKLDAKGVASVRSRVVNLSDIEPSVTVGRLADAMEEAFSTVYGLDAKRLGERGFDEREIAQRRARFCDYAWVYGKSAPFSLRWARRFSWGEVSIEAAVAGGACADVAVYTDALDTAFAAPLARALSGCRLDTAALCERAAGVGECAPYAADLCALLREQSL